MKKIEKPVIVCRSKEEIGKMLETPDSSNVVTCAKGVAYNCGSSMEYDGGKSKAKCIKGNSFVCGKSNDFIENPTEEI